MTSETNPSWSLKDKFRLYKQSGDRNDVEVDRDGLSVTYWNNETRNKGKIEIIKASDIIGCVCMKAGNREPRTHLAFFTVYSYPLIGSGNGRRRKRLALSFEVDKEETFEKNLQIANTWRAALRHVMNNSKEDSTRTSIDRRKKLLVFVNPHSGPGKALQIYKKKVVSVFGEADIPHEIVVTEKANHARDMIKTLDLDQYGGCIIVSGDGLIYEVYNGLLARPDWKQAIQYPIGVIPGGSGNGLARSIAHWLDEPYMDNPILVSTLNIVYGHLSPMDLVLLKTAEGQRKLSFLSLGLGLLADIDIESERLRNIGEARFTVWALARIAKLRKYKAKISFKRAKVNMSEGHHKNRPTFVRSQTVEGEPDLASGAPPERLPRSQSVMHEGKWSSEASLEEPSRSSLTAVETDPSAQSDETEQQRQNGANSDKFASEENSGECVATPKQTSNSSIDEEDPTLPIDENALPELNEPVPDDWESVEDNFILIYACYQTHIGSDIFFAPEASPNDGIIWLLMVSGNASKANITKFLLSMDGSHVNVPGVEIIPVEALRISPSGNGGYLTVDGEVIPWGPVQGHILPGKGRIITR